MRKKTRKVRIFFSCVSFASIHGSETKQNVIASICSMTFTVDLHMNPAFTAAIRPYEAVSCSVVSNTCLLTFCLQI